MLAHQQVGLLSAAALARAPAVDGKTVASYLDRLVDLLLVRRLAPWHGNVRKRLVKSPKVYVRDSGLAGRLDGLRLETHGWKVEPLQVEEVFSSYFADEARFPPGAVAFDCALAMRNLRHEWRSAQDLYA